MKRTAYLGLSLLMMLAMAIPSLAQTQVDADNAYRTLYNEKVPAKKAELCEDYLTKFKEGGPGAAYLDPCYRIAINSYIELQNWPKVIEKADKLTQTLPGASTGLKQFTYERGMAAAGAAQNADKLVEMGEKLLTVDPNNFSALVNVSSTLIGRLPADAAAKDAALNKAMEYAKKASATPKPANVPDAAWQPYQVDIHSTIGFVLLNKLDYMLAVAEYDEVLKLDPKNGSAWLQLGFAHQGITRAAQKLLIDAYNKENDAKAAKADQPTIDGLVAARDATDKDFKEKREKAIDALAKAAAFGGPFAQAARGPLETLFKQKNNDSVDGLDALIAEKKAALGV